MEAGRRTPPPPRSVYSLPREDVALQAGTADRLKPAGVAYGRRRARRGEEGRFHGVSKGTPNVVRDARTAQLLTRSVSLCAAGFQVIFPPYSTVLRTFGFSIFCCGQGDWLRCQLNIFNPLVIKLCKPICLGV